MGMALVLSGIIALQIFIILFVIVKRMGGTVKSEAIYVSIAVITLIVLLGCVLIYF
jgi:hypothetical protein